MTDSDLDTAVATEVMGIELDEGMVLDEAKKAEGIRLLLPPKLYSSEIAAAWEVVEKSVSSGRGLYIYSDMPGEWNVAISMDARVKNPLSYVTDRSLPRAICLAALDVARTLEK